MLLGTADTRAYQGGSRRFALEESVITSEDVCGP